jgi:hypothetical protein
MFYSVFSVCFDSLVIGYVYNRLSRYFIPDGLCSYELHELLGIISVCDGFLYTENSNFLPFRCIVMSK